MTVTYSRRVADAGLGTFFHLLLRWRGSIYKLLYRELVIFTLLYCFLSVVYRYRRERRPVRDTVCVLELWQPALVVGKFVGKSQDVSALGVSAVLLHTGCLMLSQC